MTTTPPAPPKNRTLAKPATVRKAKSPLGTYGPPILVALAIIAIWYFVSYVVLDAQRRFLLPPPHELFTQAFFKGDVISDIMVALGRTAIVALVGLAIAIVIGVLWAIAMSQARWVERSLFPYAVILQCIPILALVPLIGFWFGFDYPARIIVCVLISLFPMVSNTLFGLQSVDKGQRELFQLQKASRWTVLTKLELPAALPAIFAGMRISAGLSVIGAIVGDYFFRRGEPGLGSLISNYQSRVQSAELFAAIIVACLFGVLIFALFGWIGKRVVGKWYDFSAN
ncbi:ABC transporter permease [Humibacter sp. BT305]|uniref:Nitrate ABC transporter permease n=1 Tax=Cnuibacter physcomitrellae TaxID=1619308 RepID=A0A1X9LPD8_9MICO|nr:ABC transporter permease [Cnuibacter physcomitrellae]ARJ05821.1 nitrate ABC transporter permease [Cnuibacter physcomitrellae]AXH35563.1 ABC transporter permease [Humibacter sp. BT305]MCS5496450.1 ABC transporter permease [Cnuibacter physcomitrellae]GGI36564.1 nitrate ABC transporter permease [Cnuibacter physcomitrellae]